MSLGTGKSGFQSENLRKHKKICIYNLLNSSKKYFWTLAAFFFDLKHNKNNIVLYNSFRNRKTDLQIFFLLSKNRNLENEPEKWNSFLDLENNKNHRQRKQDYHSKLPKRILTIIEQDFHVWSSFHFPPNLWHFNKKK